MQKGNKTQIINYSQLSPCGHPVITDTPLLRPPACYLYIYGQNPALPPDKSVEVWLKMTAAFADFKLRPEGY